MRRVDLSNYKPTEVPAPRLGWDDPDAKEGWCEKCKGMIPVPGRIYGYAGPVCRCNWIDKGIDDLSNKLRGAILSREEAIRLENRLKELTTSILVASLKDPEWEKQE